MAVSPTLPPGVALRDLLSVRDETDAQGRLLLEDSAPKKARRKAHKAGIAMTSIPSPYQDTPSRVGGEINQSAYEALRHDTAEILDGFAWLTTHYLERLPTWRRTVRLLFDISHIGITIPLVLFHRAVDPVPPYGRLPTAVASLFKASRGVSSAAVDLLNTQGPPSRKLTAAEVVAFADARGHLRRPTTDRACAAPTRLIERTLDVLLTGEGGDPSESILGDLLDFGWLWDFYEANDSFSQAVSNYSYVLNQLMVATGTDDVTALFDQPIPVEGSRRTFGDFTEAVVAHANSVQARLNHLLGRATPTRPIDLNALLAML